MNQLSILLVKLKSILNILCCISTKWILNFWIYLISSGHFSMLTRNRIVVPNSLFYKHLLQRCIALSPHLISPRGEHLHFTSLLYKITPSKHDFGQLNENYIGPSSAQNSLGKTVHTTTESILKRGKRQSPGISKHTCILSRLKTFHKHRFKALRQQTWTSETKQEVLKLILIEGQGLL